MAITISGENNNDKILASDGVIDQISGINIVGILTAGHLNVGSNIQLGNAGIITATTFVGNVTGNVNSTSPLLLQTGGSERFRITGNNELGIAGANYGSSGQVLTSGGSGSAVTWATLAVTGFTNGSDNRVVTATSGSGLNGEANLTFDGTTLTNTGTGSRNNTIYTSTNNSVFLTLQNSQRRFNINNVTGGAFTIYDSTASAERFRIDQYGNAGLGVAPRTSAGGINNDTNVYLAIGDNDTGIAQDGDGQLELWANNQEIANFNASNITLTKDLFIPDKLRHDGDSDTQIRFPADDTVTVETGGNERLRITSGGAVGINESSPAAQLHVENDNANASTYYLNTDAAILVQNKNSNATAKTVLKLEGPGGGGDCALVYGGGSTNLIIADRQNERLRITSGGAVSVGNNASPDGKLHVYSSSAGTVTADGDADELVLESSGNTGMSILSPGTGESSIYFGNPGTNGQKDAWIKYYHETHSTTANRRALTFRTSGTERLRIDSTGLLGLNRTPVYSGLFGGSQKGMHIGGSTAPFLRITSDTSNQGDLVLHAGNSGADISMANMTAGGDIVFWSKPTGGSMTERMRVQDNGEFQLKPPGNAACDVAFKLNNSNDSRIKFYDSGGTYRGAFGFTEYANSTDYPNFHDSFYLLTDPSSNGSLTTAMRINHNGCFILPKQPCFSVSMDNDYESSTDHTADFDTERFDQGDNFNTGNATFTAPVTGKYYMHAAIQTRQNGGSQVHIMGVSFQINGSVQASKGSGDQYLGRDTAHYITVHCIRILNLAQGDTVTVRIQLHGSVNIEGAGGTDRCNWQGYLMA